MTKYEEVDMFLKELAKEGLEVYNSKSCQNIVYNKLMHYGLSEADYTVTDEDISSYRHIYRLKRNKGKEEWFRHMEYFNFLQIANENSNLLISPERHFLTFANKDLYCSEYDRDGKYGSRNAIKLYIPVGKNNSLKYIQDLINYLEEESIWHQSKLSDGIRTDDFVIRVYSKEEAKKIIDYVNTKEENTLVKTNPFVGRIGKVGIAFDGEHSFNSTVSYLIKSYIRELVELEKTDECSIESFKSFLNNKYNQIFVDNMDSQELISECGNYVCQSFKGRSYIDFKIIMEFLMLSLDENRKGIDYFNYWDLICNIENNEKVVEFAYGLIKDSINEKGKLFTSISCIPNLDVFKMNLAKENYYQALNQGNLDIEEIINRYYAWSGRRIDKSEIHNVIEKIKNALKNAIDENDEFLIAYLTKVLNVMNANYDDIIKDANGISYVKK